MSLVAVKPGADPRLILREEELDAAIEVFVLAEAAFWASADTKDWGDEAELGRGHYRAALLLKRRPGIGVQDLARLTGLSKQAASKAIKDLVAAGYATSDAGELDARRRPTQLTPAGEAFEGGVSARLREHLARPIATGASTPRRAPCVSCPPWPGPARRTRKERRMNARRPGVIFSWSTTTTASGSLLKEYLARSGFRVTGAPDAAAARRLLADAGIRSGGARRDDAGRRRPVADALGARAISPPRCCC